MHIINSPVSHDAIADLRAGDVFYFSGVLATGRDDVYRRVAGENLPCPFDFKNGVNFHAGPIVREDASTGKKELVSIGPTSSIRMEKWAQMFIARTGLTIMIGKGGMGPQTAAACREYGAIHAVYPGGCAVLGASQIETIDNVYWRELGMPECIWVVRARELGPLIVSIDTRGNNLFAKNASLYASRKDVRVKQIVEWLEGKER